MYVMLLNRYTQVIYGGKKNIHVGEGRKLGEELGVARDNVVTELGIEEADRLVETLDGGGRGSGSECHPEASAEKKEVERNGETVGSKECRGDEKDDGCGMIHVGDRSISVIRF
ncbi:unnamed protein product [Brassica rapa subsp. trilocularis]